MGAINGILMGVYAVVFSNRWCKRENVEPYALKEW